MKSSAYVTFDPISLDTGTKVFYHEIQALKQVTDLKVVVARSYPGNDVNLKKFELEKWYPFNPYLADYFAAQLIKEYQGIDFVHLACSPAQAILNVLRPKQYTVHIIAHELKESIEEHKRYYGSYDLIHNTDPYLHEILLAHADKSDAVITASSPAKDWLLRNTKAQKIISIPHGTDIPECIYPPPNKFTLGYMGAFGPDKGLPYLCAAWGGFNRPDTLLSFAGSCCQALSSENIKNAFLNGVNNYSLLGRVEYISSFFNNISVYCQPSVTEGFGIEIPEAMSYGRPVIVTSTTGGKDLITDGVDGFIVPPRDPKAILDKIEYLYYNPEKLLEMGNKARENSKKYSWAKIEETYIKVYNEILGQT